MLFKVEAWRLAYVYLLAAGRSCKFLQHQESGTFSGPAIGTKLGLKGKRTR